MRLNGRAPALTHDVPHVDVTCDERVRQQHSVALPPHGLGAHHRDVALCAELQKLRHRGAEIRRQHVIGVSAKCLVAPRTVWRIRPWLAQPAERREVAILDAFLAKTFRKRLAPEVGVAPRSRDCPHIRKPADRVRAKQRDELVSASSGVADRPDPVCVVSGFSRTRRGHTRASLQPACQGTSPSRP